MKEQKTVVWLSLAAVGFRILHYLLFADNFVVRPDEMQNIALARNFASGDFYGVLDIYWSPLYPFLIGITSFFSNSPTLPSTIVSVIAGSLAVPATYYLIKQSYGHREAVIAAVIAVFFPHLINSMFIMGTGNIYLLLITGALIVGWKGLERNSATYYLLTGILLGLAYLTRPEAVGYLVFFALAVFAKNLLTGKIFRQPSTGQVAALLLGFALLAAPYIFFLRSATGAWTISAKAATNTVMSGIRENKESDVSAPNFDRQTGKVFIKTFVSNLVEIQKTFSYLLPLLLMIFVTLGLFGERWSRERMGRETYLIVFCLFTVAGYAASVVQDRYFYILLPIFFGWMARGIIQSERWLHESIQSWMPNRFFYLINTKAVVVLCVIFIYLYVLPLNYFVRPKDSSWRSEAYEERDAGLWLKENGKSSPTVFSASRCPVFYAQGKQLSPAITDTTKILAQIKDSKVDYVISDERSVKRNPYLKNFTEILQNTPEFELVYRKNDQPGYEISIFKLK